MAKRLRQEPAERPDRGDERPLRLRHRILLGYLLPALVLLVVAAVVYQSAQAAEDRAARQEETQRGIVQAFRISNAFEALVADNRGYIATGDPLLLQAYQEELTRIRELATLLNATLDDPRAVGALGAVMADVEEYARVSRIAQEQAAEGDRAAAFETLESQGLPVVQQVRADIEELVEARSEVIAQARDESDAAMNFLLWAVLGAIALGLLASVLGGIFIAARTARDVEDHARVLGVTSSELAATTSEHERMATQQAAAVSQTTATMTELSSSARQTDEQAQEATERAQKALSLAETGAEAMRETAEAVTKLQERMEKMTGEVEELREETDQVGVVTSLVRDIADQTNMLAINASVEAARAGEHGRGFAVVAAEIRKLSDESRRSADRIAGHLADIQRSANATGRVAEEGARTLRKVVEFTKRSGEAFEGVTEAVNEAYERMQQISHSARQQSAAIQQVVEAMEGASAGVRETAAGVRQTKSGIQRIESVADALRQSV